MPIQRSIQPSCISEEWLVAKLGRKIVAHHEKVGVVALRACVGQIVLWLDKAVECDTFTIGAKLGVVLEPVCETSSEADLSLRVKGEKGLDRKLRSFANRFLPPSPCPLRSFQSC